MSQSCLKCGGTGVLISGELCPDCNHTNEKVAPIVTGIPMQYQGIAFDKTFLPTGVSKEYGEFMEELLSTIVKDIAFYQKNMIICSRPNSGKTIWAYNLYAELIKKGHKMPPLLDLTEVNQILHSYDDRDLSNVFIHAKCAVVKIPRGAPRWVFNSIADIVEVRVRNNGFTIFLFGGTVEELKEMDASNLLKYLRGNGAFNTLKIEEF